MPTYENLTGAQLAAAYNAITSSTIKKFENRDIAMRRVAEAAEKHGVAMADIVKFATGDNGDLPAFLKRFKTSKTEATAKRARRDAARIDMPRKRRGSTKTKRASSPAGRQERRGAKPKEMARLMQRKGGATIADLEAATGWLPHTIRAFISVQLRKKMKLNIETHRVPGGSTFYLIPS